MALDEDESSGIYSLNQPELISVHYLSERRQQQVSKGTLSGRGMSLMLQNGPLVQEISVRQRSCSHPKSKNALCGRLLLLG